VCPEKDFSPIVALNPYQSQWTIKVKLGKMFELRRFNSKKEPFEEVAVFSAVLVDDQATEIEGTFWREAAEYYHSSLQEGKVYYFSNFSVRPANKKFSSVDFEYALHFDARTKVEEAMNQDTTRMQAKVELTEFTDLPKFIEQPTLVNVLGIVTNVAATGTVKRRADSTELLRRDVTIIDKSLKSISLTLWSTLAETVGNELEQIFASDPPVVLAKNVRVNSFNGISLASINRTEIEINPDMAAAQQLRDWYGLIGKTETATPLNEGMSNPRQSFMTDEPKLLKDVDVEQVPNVGEKATYSTVNCTLVYINPDQTMYYLANKENNRKVVEQDGKYFCEFNNKVYDTAELRYVVSMKIADFSKECWVNVFNDQAEELIGMSASALEEMRKDSQENYKAHLEKCRFKSVTMRLKSEAREMPTSGEVTLRHSVASVRPLNFKEETEKNLQEIDSFN